MRIRAVRTPRLLRLEASGAVDLDALLSTITSMAQPTREHGDRRVLVNLLQVEGELNTAGHMLLGQYVVQHWSHLEKLASVVPVDRITRVTEKVAQAQGVALRVFDSEAAALDWLFADDAPVAPGAGQATMLMDPTRCAFWHAFRHLFPPHAQAVQTANGNLVIAWSLADDPHALFEMSTPITIRFEPELLALMRMATPDMRKRVAARQEPALRSGLQGYDPYAMVPKARVIVLG